MTTTHPTTATQINLTDVDAFVAQRHFGMLAWLRDNVPVYWHPNGDSGFWALTRYDDLVTAYTRHDVFSSTGGAMLGGSFRDETDTAANRMLVASDPPRHRMLRQVMHRIFAPDYVAKVEQQVRVLVDAAFDRALANGGCDFASEIAPELPAGALMATVGLTHEEAHEVISMTRRMIGYRDPFWVDIDSEVRLRLAVIQAEIFEFFADVLRRRRKNPDDGLVSILATATVNGRPLSDEDILYNCMNVAVGGDETSSYSACAGMLALAENPDQYQLLLATRDVDAAVNEVLRWSSTNAYVQRVALRDTEIAGTPIRAGDSVTLWNVSANRDPRQFPDPHTFKVNRSPNRHLTYGSGIHRCVGAPVAQVELPIVLDRLIRDKITFAVSGDVVRLRSNFILGINSLPLEVSR